MGEIRLTAMEFYAYHGCYREEQLIGNYFSVDLMMETDMEKASKSDDLNDALNYAEVYELVKGEMSIASHLLEYLCARILDKIFDCFPQLYRAEIRISKLNPPVGGPVESVSVCQRRAR